MGDDVVDRLLELIDKRLFEQRESMDRRVDKVEASVARVEATVQGIGDRLGEQSEKIAALDRAAVVASAENLRRWVSFRTRETGTDSETLEMMVAVPVRRGLMVAIGTAVVMGILGWLGLSL